MKYIRSIYTKIEEIKIDIFEEVAILNSTKRLKVLSSAVVGGGYNSTHNLLNMSVPSGYCSDNPSQDILNAAKSCGTSDIIGMMTAANVQNTIIKEKEGVVVMATAGTSNAATPGEEAKIWGSGTVNIFVVVEEDMTPACMANAIITVTEAKSHAFNFLDIRSTNSGMPATGTTTDSVAIASMSKGTIPHHYASTATELGRDIGCLVLEAVLGCLETYNGKKRNRPFISRLLERKCEIEEKNEILINLFKNKYGYMIHPSTLGEMKPPLSYIFIMALDYISSMKKEEKDIVKEAIEFGKMISSYDCSDMSINTYQKIINDEEITNMINSDPMHALIIGYFTKIMAEDTI